MLPISDNKNKVKDGLEELRASGTTTPYSDEIEEEARIPTLRMEIEFS